MINRWSITGKILIIKTKITFYETYVLKKIQDEGADADPEKYENEIEMENFAPSEAYDSPNLSYYVHVWHTKKSSCIKNPSNR